MSHEHLYAGTVYCFYMLDILFHRVNYMYIKVNCINLYDIHK